MTIAEILNSDDLPRIKALFTFDKLDDTKTVAFKFGLWARYTQPKYFKSKDAPFHKDIINNLVLTYRGEIEQFVNVAFRGASKTAMAKLFIAFCILNDTNHFRRYIKVLSVDGVNSKQIVTDIYNMMVSPRCKILYPEIFSKTDTKREETMGSFTTATGAKMISDVVGSDQRGALQEDAKSDLLIFEDIETRGTLRSAVKTKAIWDNMEEARTGLAVGGSAIYNCNYISERGNVHTLITRQAMLKTVLIVPILTKEGLSAWPDRYSLEQIEQMRITDDDFEGERMCVKPGTLILTEKGLVAINKLKVGDLVWTHENRLQKIKTVFQSQAEDLLDITVGGAITTITKNHPVLVKRNNETVWLPAGELCTKDLIVKVRHGNLCI